MHAGKDHISCITHAWHNCLVITAQIARACGRGQGEEAGR